MAIMVYKEVGGELLQQLLMDNPNTNILCSKFNAIVQPPRLSHDPHNFTDIFCTMEEGGPHVTIVQGLANGYGAELERTFCPGITPPISSCPIRLRSYLRAIRKMLWRPGFLSRYLSQGGSEAQTGEATGRKLSFRE
jgi:Xaa-Pro dipeptidase